MRRNFIARIIVSALILSTTICLAQVTLTWTGNSTRPTTWDKPGNWDLNYVPGLLNNVLIPSGLTNYPTLTFSEQNCRNITIRSGAHLNWAPLGTAVLNVGGTWQDQGTFSPGNGTIRLVTTQSCSLSAETFNRLENNKYIMTPFGPTIATATMLGDINILNEITFQYGVLDAGGNNLNGIGTANRLLLSTGQLKWGRETFTTTFETVNFDSGTVYFNRMGNQTIPSAYNYNTLYTGGSGVKTLDGDLRILNTLYVVANTALPLGENDARVGGNVTIGGALSMGDNSVLSMNGGTLRVVGHASLSAIGTGMVANGPIVTRPLAGALYYVFSVEDSATLSASYATFEYMNGQGLYIGPSALIDPEHPLDHCLFQNGENITGASALLTVENSQEIVIPNADFPVVGVFNAKKDYDTGRVTFVDASGLFAGATYEYDPYNRIDWTVSLPPAHPLVTIMRRSSSAELIWNTVRQNTGGFPIVVNSYKVYSDTEPHGLFNHLETTVAAPDTHWTDVDIINLQAIKFYLVTAVHNN